VDIPHVNVAYHFEQRVEMMCRESEKTSPTNEVYSRQGILLLSAGVENSRWKREISEYEIETVQLQKIREQPKVERSQLAVAHLAAINSRHTRFGLSFPVELDSDMRNTDVAIPGPERSPLRQDLLYLPTILPVMPEKRAEPGMEWKGSLLAISGAGRFPVAYGVKTLARIADNPQLQITIDAQNSSVTLNQITLVFSPQGSCVVDISKEDGTPLHAQGDLTFSLRAKLDRDGTPVNVEVIKCHQKFTLTKIPASFDDDYFYPGAWTKEPAK